MNACFPQQHVGYFDSHCSQLLLTNPIAPLHLWCIFFFLFFFLLLYTVCCCWILSYVWFSHKPHRTDTVALYERVRYHDQTGNIRGWRKCSTAAGPMTEEKIRKWLYLLWPVQGQKPAAALSATLDYFSLAHEKTSRLGKVTGEIPLKM